MELNCPYNEFDLRIAGASITEEMAKNVEAVIKDMEAKGLNSFDVGKIADYHKISTEVLANSPNREKLVGEFQASIMCDLIDAIIKAGLTHKQAWAILAYSIPGAL